MAAILEKLRHFKNGGHFELENVKFGFLDLKNPRKVLLHKIIVSEKRNLPKYSQYDILGGGHFGKWPPFSNSKDIHGHPF